MFRTHIPGHNRTGGHTSWHVSRSYSIHLLPGGLVDTFSANGSTVSCHAADVTHSDLSAPRRKTRKQHVEPVNEAAAWLVSVGKAINRTQNLTQEIHEMSPYDLV
ncbi:unnamed protein product [Protopolystoma xenopodis]|uniref:Uncharacterized protein n=1 Tax=Protopolystoma xenopodis TaxID=117903 RepID=A0A3S5B064_9PLAT|nr:unnamed protein product [Protopolystoma xenopodis]